MPEIVRIDPARVPGAVLIQLVRELQFLMYWDYGEKQWDPDKELDSDTLGEFVEAMARHYLDVRWSQVAETI